MGYNTKYDGQLRFAHVVTVRQIALLNQVLGESAIDLAKQLGKPRSDEYGYIDLELAPDLSALKWSGSEKTYFLDKSINLVIDYLRKHTGDFRLSGSMTAQGEDVSDRRELFIDDDGYAHERKIAPVGAVIICPECSHKFIIDKE